MTLLSTHMNSANVFVDTNPDVTVTAEDALPDSVNSSITINVTPLPASVSGRVFNDTNADGIFDDSDTGISGFRVFLDTNDNGILDAGEVSKPVSATGQHIRLQVYTPGTYRVRESVPLRMQAAKAFRRLWLLPRLTLRSAGDVAKEPVICEYRYRAHQGYRVPGREQGQARSTSRRARLGGLDALSSMRTTTEYPRLPAKLSTLSDANGSYRFFNIPAGTLRSCVSSNQPKYQADFTGQQNVFAHALRPPARPATRILARKSIGNSGKLRDSGRAGREFPDLFLSMA